MMTFCGDECNTLYKALRYYQMNKTVVDSKEYWKCDAILLKLQPHSVVNELEPAYKSDT